MSTTNTTVLDQVLSRINSGMDIHKVTPGVVIETKQYTPLRFIERYFRKEMVLLHRFSETRIRDALRLFISEAGKTMQKLDIKDIDFQLLFKTAIFYNIAASCANSRPPANSADEILDEGTGNLLIQQSSILSTKYDKYTSFVHNNFANVLSAIGSHSNSVYDYFFSRIRNEVLNQKISQKALPVILRPWIYMPGSIYNIQNSFSQISSNIGNISEKYRQHFCDMIRMTVLTALKRDLPAFSRFLTNEKDMHVARTVLESIQEWNHPNNNFAWPAQFVIQFLLPAELRFKSDFANALLQFDQYKSSTLKTQAIYAILSGFRVLVLSNNHRKIHTYMDTFFQPLYNWFIENNGSPFSDPSIDSIAFVDFPIAVLYYSPNDFDDHIVKILMDPQYPQRAHYMGKIVHRFCKLISAGGYRQLMVHLYEPTISLFNNALKDQSSLPILQTVTRGFQYCPIFMRNLSLANDQFIPTFFKTIKENLNFGFHYSLLGYFDASLASEYPVDAKAWSTIQYMLSFFSDVFQKVGLYQETQFTDAIPQLVMAIANFLIAAIQNDKLIVDEESTQANSWKDALSNIEFFALVFLASEKMAVRQTGVSLLSSLLEITHGNSAFQNEDMPLNSYQSLVSSARAVSDLSPAHPSIKWNLRTISKPSEGIAKAHATMNDYFISAIRAISPNIQLEQKSTHEIHLTGDALFNSWLGSCCIVFGISYEGTIPILKQFNVLLSDNTYIGDKISQYVPSMLNFNIYGSMIAIVARFINKFKPDINSESTSHLFDSSSPDAVFLRHALRFTTGLLDQTGLWNSQMIRNDTFAKVAHQFITICDVTRGEEFKLPCCVMVSHMITLTNKYKVSLLPIIRFKMAKIILAWLPQGHSGSRLYVMAVLDALTDLLDDIDLIQCSDPNDASPPQEQAKNAFLLFFSAIKNRIDQVEGAAAQTVPMLCALLKQNLMIGIEHCIGMGLSGSSGVREAFISAVASVFRVPEATIAMEPAIEKKPDTLIDLLFQNGFGLIEIISGLVPYSRADKFGAGIVEAAVLRGCVFELLDLMIDLELRSNTDSNQNTLFRGNAVPARAVGHYPRVVGMKWMRDTLRPIFEKVIQNCANGISYVVDPAKLPEDSDLEANQERFRDLLNEFVDKISEARVTMPAGLVKEAQMIFNKVSEKYGGFALQILSGFLFLRFLLPAFTIPRMVGMDGIFPEKPRQTLTLCSATLMAATLHGSLDDKGPHMSVFNDVAQRAHDTFEKMFTDISQMEIGEIEPVDIDPEQNIIALRDELWPLKQQIRTTMSSREPDDPIKAQAETLIKAINKMGGPKNVRSPDEQVEGPQNDHDALMSHVFPDSQLEQMEGFITIEETEALDKSTVIIVNCSKLEFARDPMVIPYLFVQTLDKSSIETAMVLINLDKFDTDNLTEPGYFLKVLEMQCISKIKKWIFIMANDNFINFASLNSSLFEHHPEKLLFPTTLSEITKFTGQIPSSLDSVALESLKEPESRHAATISHQAKYVELHGSAFLICSPNTTIIKDKSNTSLHSVSVYFANSILSFEKRPSSSQFAIILTTGQQLELTVGENSSLFDQLMALSSRAKSIKAMNSKFQVDTSTIQWLMLNFAFINMINDLMTPSVHKSALDLVSSIVKSFELTHDVEIIKADVDRLPLKLLDFAVQISEDLAMHNVQSYWGFIKEFIRAFSYVEPQTKAISLAFLTPWIKEWVQNSSDHPEFADFICNAYNQIPYDTAAFDDIFDLFNHEDISESNIEKSIELLIRSAFEIRHSLCTEMIMSIASVSNKTISYVSQFVSDTIMSEIINSTDKNKIQFVLDVIVALIGSHLFDSTSKSMVNLIYNITRLRLSFPTNILQKHVNVIAAILNELSRHSGKNGPINVKEVCLCFCQNEGQFKDDKKRPWLACASQLGQAFAQTLGDSPLREQLYMKFDQDYSNSDSIELKGQSMIYAACFAGPHADEFVLKQLKYFASISNSPESDVNISAISLSFACLSMSETLSSKLLLFGICLLFTYHQSSTMDLIASALHQLRLHKGSNIFDENMPEEIVTELEQETLLPLSAAFWYSLYLMIAQYCDGTNTELVARTATEIPSDDAYFALIRCIYDPTEMEEIATLDFGDALATVEAAALVLFKHAPGLAWDAFFEKIIDTQAEGFKSFNCGFSKFSKGVPELAKSPHLMGLLNNIKALKGGNMLIAPLLECNFSDEEPEITITLETANQIISQLFPRAF